MVSGADLIAALDVPLHRNARLDREAFHDLVVKTKAAMLTQDPAVRPKSRAGKPGGLVYARQPRALLIPDLHARIEFLGTLLGADAAALGFAGRSVADLAAAGQACVVCLGDVLHAEGREAAERWMLAERYKKYGHGSVRSESTSARAASFADTSSALYNPPLELEMERSFASLEAVMSLKTLIPENFHCLKGNHDNASNSGDHGDFPFFKYAEEGQMTADWFLASYGGQLLRELREYELLLPLVAVGRAFCASHAEPARSLDATEILDYLERPDVVQSLIWTDNGEACNGAAQKTLASLLSRPPARIGARWFCGHRPVSGLWNEREDGFVIQIHNPDRWQFVWIDNSAPEFPSCLLFQVEENGTLVQLGRIS
ncbi:MAG TPA: hypothetical protein PLT87_01915 [Spirochaetales bacterium]|nr:hypothetical protein [Spirochaetales bacterium]